jgi:ABC-2 type transport system permease protein
VLFTALGSVLFMGIGACGAATGGSPRSAQALSSMLFFPLLFLSGAMFPLDSFPAPLQAVAHFLPSYHLYELFSFSWLRGQDLPTWSLVYVSVAAAVFATGAWFLFNRREDV